jgi:predicted nucleotidyltransferase
MSKIVAIIAEYNPFHNGHKYQIDKIREEIEDATIIAIMSGNIVQRGEFAFVDKYKRAEMAIKCGVDGVFELPYPYSGSTAEIFAMAGVKIASSLGAEYLYFGTESKNITELEKIADAISSDEFNYEIKRMAGNDFESFPKMKEEALKNLGYTVPKSSNDMLAIEYIRAIKSLNLKVKYRCIERIGAGYKENDISSYMSASGIRNSYYSTGKILSIPSEASMVIEEEIKSSRFLDKKSSEKLLYNHVLLSSPKLTEEAFDATDGLGYFIKKKSQENSIETFFDSLSTKSVTTSRIKRVLLYSLFGIKNVDKCPEFTVMLGLSERGKKALNAIKNNEELTVITKHSDSSKLNDKAREKYNILCKADEVYQTLLSKPNSPSKAYKKCPYIENKKLG